MKKQYITPSITMLSIEIEDTISNSSISTLKIVEDNTMVREEWLDDSSDEKIINWF
ncbi:hypothetical protein [Sphingobacterium bovistauri]|uniref:Uncharacterized protein n=1 Tax=Sphingobacterium bovistauri TaxID=2781959 RepID=A0ABS7Z934_9SPHI|nr:hypothetical protein [Sphingobacterium bovistauri]MCA5005204.1 hypothetical protein [Sphingobacterium bovistauri]